jgi:hypothetical protein
MEIAESDAESLKSWRAGGRCDLLVALECFQQVLATWVAIQKSDTRYKVLNVNYGFAFAFVCPSGIVA